MVQIEVYSCAPHHFKINEYSIRTIIKKKTQEKEIHEGVTTATPAGAKPLYFLQNIFVYWNAAFMWVQDD